MKDKIILITLPEDIIIRNILMSDAWPQLIEKFKLCEILLLVQPDKVEYVKSKMAAYEVKSTVIPFTRSKPTTLESWAMSLARSAINSHTNLWSKMRSYKRGHSSLFDTLLKRSITATLGNFDFYKRLIRKLILKSKIDENAKNIFDKYKPDVVITTSMTNFDFDVVVAKAAKILKVPIVGVVRSWDNLSSHGLMRVLPDYLILQNDFLKDMAYEYQAISPNEIPIKISGIPHYDVCKNPSEILMDKTELFKSLGLDPNKKLILYGAMGQFLFVNESMVPKMLDGLVTSGKINPDIQFYYRAHPKFAVKSIDVEGVKNVVISGDTKYINGNKSDFEDSKILMNLIYHSDVVLTAASTIAIDAAVLDRPVVCIAFDKPENSNDGVKINYWESVERFYDLYTHFEALVDTKGVRVAYSVDELAKSIQDYLNNPDLDKEGREEIIAKFVAPFDGMAGQRWAKQVYEACESLAK